MSMSAAEFELKMGQKLNGGLGPDERYVIRWLNKSGILAALIETWHGIVKNGGREKTGSFNLFMLKCGYVYRYCRRNRKNKKF